ncbi:HAMP domain-containing histidine kinase [Acidobacteriia bacterium AH_259_A11_L15]|nr:HAMP domain-containing histidine kinase [Acidobacteriia bacterium AH_259_A11_L15]
MKKKKWWRWDGRMRLFLTMELAVVLPAAALIGFSVWKLHSIQRDKVIEAAIQRDFQRMLKVSEKRLVEEGYALLQAVRADFPSPEDRLGPALEEVLANHPYAAHVFLYDEKTGLLFRSQPGRMEEDDFRRESEKLHAGIRWIKTETEYLREQFYKQKESGYPQVYTMPTWAPRKDGRGYQIVALFPLPKFPSERVAVGGMVFDSEYLTEEFFPAVFDKLLAKDFAERSGGGKAASSEVAMMVRPKGMKKPLATSAGWDAGKPEVERNIEMSFPGLTLAIKFQGTTVAALAQEFQRNALLVIGGLSLFLAGGILLTYRNVIREMGLAKLKSDFVSNVSHELRTPLSLIRLYAETLELGRVQTPEKQQEYYGIIRKESERLTALINNILDFSRIEAGKKEYSFTDTNLSVLVRDTLESYRYQIEQMGFAFDVRIEDNLPRMQVDREAIARSLLNLVNNAVKYSQGEKYLGVNLYRTNGLVKLEVIDHGIGIPRSEQPKVFEKFYRAGDSLVHNTKGSGVGLSLVRHIVQAHGGQISVESMPGQGSKFTIALPMQPPAGPPGATA